MGFFFLSFSLILSFLDKETTKKLYYNTSMLVVTEYFSFKGKTVIFFWTSPYPSGLIGILGWTGDVAHVNVPSIGFDMIGSKYSLCKNQLLTPLGELQTKMAEKEGNITAKSYHKNAVCKVPCCTVPMLLAIKGHRIFIACFVAARDLHQYPETNLTFLWLKCCAMETRHSLSY